MTSKFELFREKAVKMMQQTTGLNMADILVNQYELVLESDLKGVFDRVAFTVNGGFRGAERFMTETRLNLQDAFICNEWGLFLLDTGGDEDINFEEHSYPDTMYFNGDEADRAEIFYKGHLSLVVNNLILTPGSRTEKCRVSMSVEDRRSSGFSVMQDVEDGYWILSGSKNIYFNLTLPKKTDWKDSTIRLRLRLSGLLFRNATIIT
jgi:hypothetical protein